MPNWRDPGYRGDPLFTLVDKGEIELAGDVIETALNGLKPGDPAEIAVAGVGPVTGSQGCCRPRSTR